MYTNAIVMKQRQIALSRNTYTEGKHHYWLCHWSLEKWKLVTLDPIQVSTSL